MSDKLERAEEELTMIALALKNQGIEGCTPEEGVERLVLWYVNADAHGQHAIDENKALRALLTICPDCEGNGEGPEVDEFAQFREAMLSGAAVKALADECWPSIPDSIPEKAQGARAALKAALDAIDPTRKGEQR